MFPGESKKHPLQCRKCEGAVLPDRALRLRNGVWVLRYLCIYCGSHWQAVRRGQQWVLAEASTQVLEGTSPHAMGNSPLVVDDDNSERPAKAA